MALTEDWITELVNRLMEIVKEISALHDIGGVFKIMHGNMVRRIKLLSPLFEELKDKYGALKDEDVKRLEALKFSLEYALTHFKWLADSSKVYQVLMMHTVVDKFDKVSGQIAEALSEIRYHTLDIQEEALEQIELVHAQFRRAKEKRCFPDFQLQRDLIKVLKDKDSDHALVILKTLSEKLQLTTMHDLEREALAFDAMVITSGGEPAELMENISFLLMKLKNHVQVNNPAPGGSLAEDEKISSPVIPYEFRCPISLQLMQDPVIISTGQTYERSYIQKWLDTGHRTCPKTQQKLSRRMPLMTPNYAVKTLIAHWCESNGIELPKKQETCSSGKSEVQSVVAESDYRRHTPLVANNDGGVEETTLNDYDEAVSRDGIEELAELYVSEVRQHNLEELQQRMHEVMDAGYSEQIQRQMFEMDERMHRLKRDLFGPILEIYQKMLNGMMQPQNTAVSGRNAAANTRDGDEGANAPAHNSGNAAAVAGEHEGTDGGHAAATRPSDAVEEITQQGQGQGQG